MLNLIMPISYSIDIDKEVDSENFVMHYCESFDKNNKNHKLAFENTKRILEKKKFDNIEYKFDDKELFVYIKITGTFGQISDAICGEFLGTSTLGNMTFLKMYSIMLENKFVNYKDTSIRDI